MSRESAKIERIRAYFHQKRTKCLPNHYLHNTHNLRLDYSLTGQLADKRTCGQSCRGLVNWRTSQLAKMFDLKFGVYNSSKCYFGQITLFTRYAVNIR